MPASADFVVGGRVFVFFGVRQPRHAQFTHGLPVFTSGLIFCGTTLARAQRDTFLALLIGLLLIQLIIELYGRGFASVCMRRLAHPLSYARVL